jgi:hypothetical protein
MSHNQQAITSMLWHSSHTSWFEFIAGLPLVHFRFPMRYQQEVRDSVKLVFECPGPTTRKAQPLINNLILQEHSRDKIGKVIKRRYLITEGVSI